MNVRRRLSTHPEISHSAILKRNTPKSPTESSGDDACRDQRGRSRNHRGETRKRESHLPKVRSDAISFVTIISLNRNIFNRPRKSSVSFGNFSVREYDRVLGDCWDIEHGLGLGWEYVDLPAQPVVVQGSGETTKTNKEIYKIGFEIKTWILKFREKRKKKNTIVSPKEPLGTTTQAKRRMGMKKKALIKKARATTQEMLSFEDNKPTSQHRKELLEKFGFSNSELHVSELERKLLLVERKLWTRHSKRASKLFTERCLADIRDCCTSGELNVLTTPFS